MQAPRLYGSIKRLAALRAKAIKDEGVSEKQRRLRDAAVFLRNTRQCMIDDCSERTNGDVNVLDSILAPHLQEYEQHVDKDTAAAGNTEERMLKALRDAGYRWVYEVADYMGSDHVIAQEEQYSHVTTDKLYLVNQGRLDVVFDNPGSDSGNLRPGAVLLLPPKRQFSSLEVVKDGDTFWRFAQVHAPGLQLTDNAALYRLLDFNPQVGACHVASWLWQLLSSVQCHMRAAADTQTRNTWLTMQRCMHAQHVSCTEPWQGALLQLLLSL
jgi:hypothetical protein